MRKLGARVRSQARSYSLLCRTSMPVGLLLVLAAALALRAPLLGGGQIDYDEGVYWQWLRALAAGKALFTSVYSSQPPAFLVLLLPGHLVSGGGIVADRLTVLVLALAGIAAAGRTAGLLAGRWAGLLAAAVLAADPLFFRQSVTLQADGPSVASGPPPRRCCWPSSTRCGRTTPWPSPSPWRCWPAAWRAPCPTGSPPRRAWWRSSPRWCRRRWCARGSRRRRWTRRSWRRCGPERRPATW